MEQVVQAASVHALSRVSRIGQGTANRWIPQDEHYHQRDPDASGLIVDYRRKFLDSLVRGGEEEAILTQRRKGEETLRTPDTPDGHC